MPHLAETIANAVQANRFESVFGRKLGVSEQHPTEGLACLGWKIISPRASPRVSREVWEYAHLDRIRANHQWAEHAAALSSGKRIIISVTGTLDRPRAAD
jgi:hypothetical protein